MSTVRFKSTMTFLSCVQLKITALIVCIVRNSNSLARAWASTTILFLKKNTSTERVCAMAQKNWGKNVSITASSFLCNQIRNYAISVRVPKKAQRGSGGTRERKVAAVTFHDIAVFPSENILPSILSVPLWTISKRLLLGTVALSLNHWISGNGVPAARHVSIATLPFGRVWFVGPIWMIGGGMSSTDMTWKRKKDKQILARWKWFSSVAQKRKYLISNE